MTIDVDWNAAWREGQSSRRAADDSSYWDHRAPSFAKTAGTSPYAREFLERTSLAPDDTVFDMGCGSGTLALPLARHGHEVWACDFSEVMLDLMMQRARTDGVEGLVHPMKLSWDEDWGGHALPTCDVAIASRSIATDDMADALLKLEGRARRHVAITLATGTSPRIDEVLLRAIGREPNPYPDYVFGMNILWQLGRQPELSYIRSYRSDEFESFERAIDKNCGIFEASAEERSALEEYSEEHLKPHVLDDGRTVWSYDHDRVTSWGYISWDR